MKTRTICSIALAGIVVIGAVVAWLAPSGTQEGQPLQPKESDIEGGAMLYAEFCAFCHGVDPEGQPKWRIPNDDRTLPAPPHDETGHTWHHGDALLFDYTKEGGEAAMEARGVPNLPAECQDFLTV